MREDTTKDPLSYAFFLVVQENLLECDFLSGQSVPGLEHLPVGEKTDTHPEHLGLSTFAPVKYTRHIQLYVTRKHRDSPVCALSNFGQFFIFGELLTERKLNSIVIIFCH